MGKEEIIIYSSSVRTYLIELIAILYEKEYFGFEESAHQYVEQIRQSIRTDLPQEINHRTVPKELKHYGKYYIKIKGSNRTTWYVFFDKMDSRYFVEYITNNHTPQGAFFNLD